MVHAADPSHPRYESLLKRAMLEEAQRKGMLANSAMIPHGRGEAFDYLIGEQTTESAEMATREAAARLVSANSCIISVNGNVAALASEAILTCASILECDFEVNIFYRTPERMQAILRHVETCKVNLLEMDNIGLSEGTTYYIVNKAGNNFGVSASQGGSAISLTASTSETPESH